jgi:NAD(P)-dependent dehydrogenase (short-subunit alcohol dehydrogenase family)
LLTGASRGIGAAIARALIAQGVRLAVVGRDARSLRQLVGDDSSHTVLPLDLGSADDAQFASAADQAAEALGGLDGFCACAGIAEHQAVGRIAAESLARQLRVNFTAAFLMGQRAGELIAEQGGGAMLFVASTLGLQPAPRTAAYAASKAALISSARSFALELGPRGVRVNAIAPGVVDTDMVRVVRPMPGEAPPDGAEDSVARAAKIENQLAFLRNLHPLGRLGGPADVAETAVYLLRATFVSGAVVPVDGGLLLGSGEL